MKKMVFIIPPTVELLDLAGPVQVFTEAKFYGFEAEMEFYQFQETPVSTSGLGFGKIARYTEAKLGNDICSLVNVQKRKTNPFLFTLDRRIKTIAAIVRKTR